MGNVACLSCLYSVQSSWKYQIPLLRRNTNTHPTTSSKKKNTPINKGRSSMAATCSAQRQYGIVTPSNKGESSKTSVDPPLRSVFRGFYLAYVQKTGVLLVQKHCFKPYLVDENFYICSNTVRVDWGLFLSKLNIFMDSLRSSSWDIFGLWKPSFPHTYCILLWQP